VILALVITPLLAFAPDVDQAAPAGPLVLVDRGRRRVPARDGTVTLRRNGFARSNRLFLDYDLEFDMRFLESNSQLTITVRARGGVGDPLVGDKLRFTSGALAAPPDQWRRCRIHADGGRVSVSVDNVTTFARDVGQFGGYVVFEQLAGSAEIRDIRIAPFEHPFELPPNTLRNEALKQQGATSPKLREETRPFYTYDTLRALIQGAVLLEAVVLPDGTVGSVRITRSLHPQLDISAIGALKAWRFDPATLNGTPVPCLVEVSLSFTLK
jgi:TonB family protein